MHEFEQITMLLIHLTDINQRINPNTVPTLSDQSVWIFYDFLFMKPNKHFHEKKQKQVLNQV